MSKRKHITNHTNTILNDINNSVQAIVTLSHKKEDKIDQIKINTDNLVTNANSKLPTILAIIGTVAAVIGVIVTIIGIIIPFIKSPSKYTSGEAMTPTETSTYEIYLYPDYKRLEVNAETDITASLNFDTEAVNIDAFLDSAHNGDTVTMTQKNSSEWRARVYFSETGTFEVVASAIAPDGTLIKGTVKIEVISIYE